MSEKILDLFVIGGGINGAGIARDAAGRGLSVAMCEKDDLAQAHLLVPASWYMAGYVIWNIMNFVWSVKRLSNVKCC